MKSVADFARRFSSSSFSFPEKLAFLDVPAPQRVACADGKQALES